MGLLLGIVPMVQDDERKPEKWTLLMLSHFPSNAAEDLLQNPQEKEKSLFQLHQYCYQSTEICVWMLSGWDCPKAWMATGTSASSWRKNVHSCWHKQVTNGETGCHQVMRIVQTLLFWCKDSLNRSMTVPPMLTVSASGCCRSAPFWYDLKVTLVMCWSLLMIM